MAHLVNNTSGGRQSYRSSWMSRWVRKSCNVTGETLNYSSDASQNDLNYITEDVLEKSRSVKGLGLGVMETVTSELVNGSRRLSSESLRNERSCSYLFKDGQENDDTRASAHEIDQEFECGKAIYPTSGIQILPVLLRVPAANDTLLPQSECFRECNTALVLYAPSMSDHHFPTFNQELFQETQKLSCYPASPSCQGKQGVILEPLTCLADNEGRENAGDIKPSKVTGIKVSSSESDTMDMNFVKETNPHLGDHNTSSDKASQMDANSDSSSSKAPGLEQEMLMEHAGHTIQKSNLHMNESPDAEPYSRWVKRLKLSSSHSSARGMKCINLAENSSKKRKVFCNRIIESGVTRSESILRMHHGEKSMALDKSTNLSKENLGNDSSLSWIQRWLSDGSKFTRKKPHTMMGCEPQSLKWALEDLQKDRSPSIRAMALMGKAMKSFQPCELEKRGSLTLWNTKAV